MQCGPGVYLLLEENKETRERFMQNHIFPQKPVQDVLLDKILKDCYTSQTCINKIL